VRVVVGPLGVVVGPETDGVVPLGVVEDQFSDVELTIVVESGVVTIK
jgi:hypothetical protein